MMHSVYKANVSQYFGGPEYIPFIQDVLRIIIIHTLTHFMYAMKDGGGSISLGNMVEQMMYVSLGAMVYWLVFRKFIDIV
jgi:hypothetical protein